jgi:hypothetical protein
MLTSSQRATRRPGAKQIHDHSINSAASGGAAVTFRHQGRKVSTARGKGALRARREC